MGLTKSQFRVYVGIEGEIKAKAGELITKGLVDPPKTRADWLRLLRASIELLPAVPAQYLDNKARGGDVVIERPRGVAYE